MAEYFQLWHRGEEWAWYDKPCHLHHVSFVGRHFNETVFRNTCENALWGAKVRCQDSSIVPLVVAFPSCHQSCASEAKWPARVPGILSYTPPAPAVVWFGPFPSDLASSYLAFPHTGVWSPALVYLLTPTGVMEGPHHPKWCISDTGWGLWVHFYTLLECSPHSLFPFPSSLNERCEGSSLLGPAWPLPAKAGSLPVATDVAVLGTSVGLGLGTDGLPASSLQPHHTHIRLWHALSRFQASPCIWL